MPDFHRQGLHEDLTFISHGSSCLTFIVWVFMSDFHRLGLHEDFHRLGLHV